VLEAACRQAILWNPGVTDSDGGVRMAVNISPRQFEQQDIVGLVRKTLSDTGLAPSHATCCRAFCSASRSRRTSAPTCSAARRPSRPCSKRPPGRLADPMGKGGFGAR
jgi:hypothetical protein